MSTYNRVLSILFLFFCALTGAPLLIGPGRFLGLFSWAPVDPLISRVLGAALLGMAWGAWRTLQKPEIKGRKLSSEMFVIFTFGSGFGWLRNLLGSYWWPGIWAVLGLFFLFGFAWLLVRIREKDL